MLFSYILNKNTVIENSNIDIQKPVILSTPFNKLYFEPYLFINSHRFIYIYTFFNTFLALFELFLILDLINILIQNIKKKCNYQFQFLIEKSFF